MIKKNFIPVDLKIDNFILSGILRLPKNAKSLIIFAYGSGSSWKSPRDNFVADELYRAGIASLLLGLLTDSEDEVYENRFNINLLANRLVKITKKFSQRPEVKDLKIGLFGASTGSAAALLASINLGSKIKAIVSRGGRPDLVMDFLSQIKAPTLLIVGGNDNGVIDLNQQAFEKLNSTKKIIIVPGATHLFEEPGALEQVAKLAKNWFLKMIH